MKIWKTIIQQAKRRVLIVFDDVIGDMESNNKLILRGRKLNISFVFISQSYFKVPKTIRLNTTHYFRKLLTSTNSF